MSSAELHPAGAPTQRCRDRKARFRYRGVTRADCDHPPSLLDLRRGTVLCFECYRCEMNRARARWLTETAAPPPTRSPFARQGAAGGGSWTGASSRIGSGCSITCSASPPWRPDSGRDRESSAGLVPARRIGYLDWTEKVVAGCRGTNAALERYYDEVLKKGRSALAMLT